MSEKKQEFHGSDLEKVEAYYGIKKEDIIPFAGNVNPLGISPLLKKSMASHIESISEYPDRDYKELRSTLALYCNVPMEHIIAVSYTHLSLLDLTHKYMPDLLQNVLPSAYLIPLSLVL